MKNKRLLVTLSVLFVTVALFSGCSKEEVETSTEEIIEAVEPVEEVVEQETEVADVEMEETTVVEEPVVDNEISDNWKDGEFLLDGVKIKMPVSFKELEKLGWFLQIDRDKEYLGTWKNEDGSINEELSTKNDLTIDPHHSYFSDMLIINEAYEQDFIFVVPYNSTDDELDIADCITTALGIEKRAKAGTPSIDVVLPKGITYGSTEQEIIDAYGEPSDYQSGDTWVSLKYDADDTFFRMHLDIREGKGLTGISLHWDEYLPY